MFENTYRRASKVVTAIEKQEAKIERLKQRDDDTTLRRRIGNVMLVRDRRSQNAEGKLEWLYKNLNIRLPYGAKVETIDELVVNANGTVALKPTVETAVPEIQSEEITEEAKIPA